MSGNYALRFDMYLAVGGEGTFSTELALLGLNHDTLHTNWFKNSGVPDGWTFDGLWCWIEADGAQQYAGDDYRFSGPVSGNIMLGYCDPANSVGPQASSVIYANARVLRGPRARARNGSRAPPHSQPADG